METKECVKCGKVKSLSMFYVNRNSCKICLCNAEKAQRRDLSKEKISFILGNDIYHNHFNNKGTKRHCKKCGMIDNVSLFISSRCIKCYIIARSYAGKKYRDNLTDIKKEERKQYRQKYQSTSKYKEKHAAQSQKWREEHPDEQLKRSRQQYKKFRIKKNAIQRDRLKTDKEYRDNVRDRGREYTKSGKRKAVYWRNPERYRAITYRNRPKYADKIKVSSKKWNEANKELILSYSKNKVNEMHDCYLRSNIKRRELIATKDITPELIQLEKEKLKLFRATR